MFVQKGQVEHVLTMANLKLKLSLFTPRPNVQDFCYLELLLGMIMIVTYAGVIISMYIPRGVITFLVSTKGGVMCFCAVFCW